MITKAPRGTCDILPEAAPHWKYIEKVAAETARNFGFSEIRTPVFEHTELFERGVGDTTDVVQKEMYTFLDKGERSITLRPEGTASVARAYLENSLYANPQPTKLFYNISCYRYEKPQAGRLREFHQFGCEAFGSPSPSLDAELITLVDTFLKKLGITDVSLYINSIGCPECRKKYNDALISYFKEHEETLCETCRKRLYTNPMRILDCKSPICKKVNEGAPVILDYICDDCSEHFNKVKETLDAVGISYTIDPYIVRGLDYYTKTVFEFVSTNIGSQGTVCGGGRYDNLLRELDPSHDIPGIGFAIGIERLLLIMQAQGINFPEVSGPDIYVASLGEDIAVSKLVTELRRKGIYAECDHLGRSLKAQMKQADKQKALYSLVLGSEEVKNGSATLKNMQDGSTQNVNINNTDDIIKVLGGK